MFGVPQFPQRLLACCAYADDTVGDDVLHSSNRAEAQQLDGVQSLSPLARQTIKTFPDRVFGLVDMDGTLCTAGQELGPRALEVIRLLNNNTGDQQSAGVITAQSREYLEAMGGDVFDIRVTEKCQRIVVPGLGPLVFDRVDTTAAFDQATSYLQTLGSVAHVNRKASGFAVIMGHYPQALHPAIHRKLFQIVRANQGLAFEPTPGFIDVVDERLNKMHGFTEVLRILDLPTGTITLTCGNGSTDVPMILASDIGVEVNRPEQEIAEHVRYHHDVLDILEYFYWCLKEQGH